MKAQKQRTQECLCVLVIGWALLLVAEACQSSGSIGDGGQEAIGGEEGQDGNADEDVLDALDGGDGGQDTGGDNSQWIDVEIHGMRDIVLIYTTQPQTWRTENFKPYLAYLDKAASGAPRDWFFDSFLFSQGNITSERSFLAGNATWSDWLDFQDGLLSPGGYFDILDQAIEELKPLLGDLSHRVFVIVMIPYLSPAMTGFGDVDGDNQEENPALKEDRIKAIQVYSSAVYSRFLDRGYRNLDLWGYYWMNEGIFPDDEWVVQQTALHVHHDLGRSFIWIPYFQAIGWDRSQEFGFDLAMMQPSMAFLPLPIGGVVPDENRLSINANLARSHGMGVEIEMNYQVDQNPSDQLNLQMYLNHGSTNLDGYGSSDQKRAWFQSVELIGKLYSSTSIEANRLYQDCYRFHRGSLPKRALSMAEGAVVIINGSQVPSLTDGLWMTRVEQALRILTMTAPTTMDLSLNSIELVGDVRVHLAAQVDNGMGLPEKIRIQTSLDGISYEPAGEFACPSFEVMAQDPNAPGPVWRAGFALALFKPRLAKAVRVELLAPAGRILGVDEVVILPAKHDLWNASYALTGQLSPDSMGAGDRALVDGRIEVKPGGSEALRFVSGSAKIHFDLANGVYLDQAMAHVRWPQGSPIPSSRVVTPQSGTSDWVTPTTNLDGWMVFPLNNQVITDVINFELSGEDASWDEFQIRRPDNLALHMPYRLNPGHTASYPDSNGFELQDGQLSQGFGDGKTVGWQSPTPKVSIFMDLGDQRTINEFRYHAQSGGYGWVYEPSSIEVFASTDASTWTPVIVSGWTKGVTSSQLLPDGTTMEMAWNKGTFDSQAIRFLRVDFVPHGWLMLSEIQVINDQIDPCQGGGCSYSTLPAPYSGTSYADNTGVLTDGELTGQYDNLSKSVGWQEKDVEIIVDLLRTTKVQLMRLHSLSWSGAGVYFPVQVVVSTSQDGQAWTTEAPASAPPGDSDATIAMAFQDAALLATPARFVRIRTTSGGWMMLDEIEIY